MNYHWNWGIFFDVSPDGSDTYLRTLLDGLGWTLATALTAWVVALMLGAVIGTLRTTPLRWAVRLGSAYVELFRNIPLLVQMFLWFFVVPELLPKAMGIWLKQLPNASFWTAVVALAFFTSARVAEQVRAGINSLPRGGIGFWNHLAYIFSASPDLKTLAKVLSTRALNWGSSLRSMAP